MTRWIKLLIAAGVIAALVVGLILVRRAGNNSEPEAAVNTDFLADFVTILDIPRETITALSVEREDADLVLRPNADGTFRPDYEYDVRFDNSRVNRIVGSVSSLRSRRVIAEEPEGLEEYGLDNPGVTVTALVEGEDPVTLVIGNRTPSGDAFYAMASGDPRVYSISTTWLSPFFMGLDDLRDKTVPQINPQALGLVEITNIDGREIRVEPPVAGDDNPELSLTTLVVTRPYSRWYGVSTTWLEEVAAALPTITIVRFADDNPLDLASYGLAPPIAEFRVSDDRTTLHMTIGESTDGGRFARFGESGSVFVVSGVEEIISSTPYETMSSFSYIINIDLIDSIEIGTPSGPHVARISRSPGESEDEPIETFFYDDEEVEEDIFRDLYQWLIGLLLDGEADGSASGAPELSITYINNDGRAPVRIDYVKQDANYHAVFRDGVSEFVAASSKIQRLLTVLEDPTLLADD